MDSQTALTTAKQCSPAGKTLAKFRGKLFGNKNKLPPGTVDIPPSAFDYGSSMSMQQVDIVSADPYSMPECSP